MVKSKVLMFSDLPIRNIQPSLYHEADIDIFAQKMFTRTYHHQEVLISTWFMRALQRYRQVIGLEF